MLVVFCARKPIRSLPAMTGKAKERSLTGGAVIQILLPSIWLNSNLMLGMLTTSILFFITAFFPLLLLLLLLLPNRTQTIIPSQQDIWLSQSPFVTEPAKSFFNLVQKSKHLLQTCFIFSSFLFVLIQTWFILSAFRGNETY